MSKNLVGIEIGRGIAASMVVFYHAARHLRSDIGYLPWGGIFQFGHAGVDFFFVLSGFIIYYIHQQDFDQPERAPQYLLKRAVRIYPLFIIAIIISLVMTSFSSHKTLPGIDWIIRSLTLLPFSEESIIGVAWTLKHEIMFYLIFSTLILNKKIGFILISSWLLLIAINWNSSLEYLNKYNLAYLASPYNIQFFFGMLAAFAFRKNNTKNKTLIIGVIAFIIICIMENTGYLNGYTNYSRISYGLSAMLIVIGLANLVDLNSLLFRIMNSLGSASYAIYLLHLPIIGVIYKILIHLEILENLPVWLTYLILSLTSLAGGIFISKYIEKPLLKTIRKIFNFGDKTKLITNQVENRA